MFPAPPETLENSRVRENMESHSCARRRALALVSFFAALIALPAAHAAPASAELQKRVRAATFEVVLRKPEKDPLTYEKPLPLDLLPYMERTDKYLSIGTAFTVAPGLFISAGHVMLSGIDSQFGAPALRDSSGNVFPIDRVVKFSLHEDFMVFTVSPAPAATPLETSPTPALDETVYAVGNALGDGVVIRDGLLTSMTPEDQDGRWKWLRFSAAASPGNSGGPLLDAQGRVVGVVTMRSPGENLNFALPVDRVDSASTSTASYDVRESFGLPMLQDTQVSVYKGTFPLPLPFAEFAKRYRESLVRHFRTERDRLLKDEAAELFPKGTASKLLAVSERPEGPALVTQEDDHTWTASVGDERESADLPGEGKVELRSAKGTFLFSLHRPNDAYDDAFYSDSRAFMDVLLKGLKLPRYVGSQEIRITSAGPALRDTPYEDKFGRRWQMRVWQLGYVDTALVVAALPVPDGYVGMMGISAGIGIDTTTERLQLLTGFFQSPFEGTLPQWQAYLARKPLRAKVFDGVKLKHDAATGLVFESARMKAAVPADLLKLSDGSRLSLNMLYLLDGEKLVWDIGALTLMEDLEGETYVGAYRQPKPASDAGRELLQRWDRMLKRDVDFNGTVRHDQNFTAMSITTALGRKMTTEERPDPSSTVLYEVVYRTDDRLLPREMDARKRKLMQALTILEN
jgi:S1-C subfamily serine protease